MRHIISKSIVKLVEENLEQIFALRSKVKKKRDGSFVSEADIYLQEIIIKEIYTYFPNHIVISEELDFSNTKLNYDGSYIIIDPIDGTENFVSGMKEWGIGISVFTNGKHFYSLIYLPELNEVLDITTKIKRFQSRITGISSSLKTEDLKKLKFKSFEYRITGCSMYNMFCAITGRFKSFENVKGVNCWDILPGLNIGLQNKIPVFVNEKNYKGQLLFPGQKYKIRIG